MIIKLDSLFILLHDSSIDIPSILNVFLCCFKRCLYSLSPHPLYLFTYLSFEKKIFACWLFVFVEIHKEIQLYYNARFLKFQL